MEDDLTKKKKKDLAIAVGKAAVSAIPVAGGPLAVLFEEFFPGEWERRVSELLTHLSEDFKRVEDQLDEQKVRSEEFFSTFYTSFRLALSTHQKEKIDCYRAIILNSALENSPNEDEQALFIKITDDLTVLHVKILKILKAPELYLNENTEAAKRIGSSSLGSLDHLFRVCLPDYPDDNIKIAFKDLHNLGLHNTPNVSVMMTS